jgi:hypothetical protein
VRKWFQSLRFQMGQLVPLRRGVVRDGDVRQRGGGGELRAVASAVIRGRGSRDGDPGTGTGTGTGTALLAAGTGTGTALLAAGSGTGTGTAAPRQADPARQSLIRRGRWGQWRWLRRRASKTQKTCRRACAGHPGKSETEIVNTRTAECEPVPAREGRDAPPPPPRAVETHGLVYRASRERLVRPAPMPATRRPREEGC